MLSATKCLLDLYKKDQNQELKRELKNAYTQAIRHYGSQEDAEALLPAFLEAAEQRDELILQLQPIVTVGLFWVWLFMVKKALICLRKSFGITTGKPTLGTLVLVSSYT
jgi:hypothetical protein